MPSPTMVRALATTAVFAAVIVPWPRAPLPFQQKELAIRMEPQVSGTTTRLISVSAVNRNVVWAAGARGTFVRTTDGGATWTSGQVRGADSLEFRDVHAVSANTAYVLSIGNGPSSRIYKTTDAGATWLMQFINRDSSAFFDCFGFWSPERGVAISDAIKDQIIMITTTDGKRWGHVSPYTLPPALEGEGSFASSGTCLVTGRRGRAWFGTTKGRVFRTTNSGKQWRPSLTPITVTDSTGVASISFRNNNHGAAFGGYGGRPTDTLVAVTTNGGESWTVRSRPPIAGGVWAGAYIPNTDRPTMFVVGRTGSAYSLDDGRTWKLADTQRYWGLTFAHRTAGWAVGDSGRIVKIGAY